MTPIAVTLNGTAVTTAVAEFRVLGIDRGMFGDDRNVVVNIPGRAGAWIYDEEPGERPIIVTGRILADGTAARRTAVNALAAWATRTSQASLAFGDETDRFYRVRYAGMPKLDDTTRYTEVELEFAAEPYALAAAESTETLSLSGASPKSGTFSVSDAVPAEPVIEITPTNGTITGFELVVNGETITWGGTLADDTTLTISSISDTVTLGASIDADLTGAFDEGDVDMATVTASAFPELANGSNSWQFIWTGTATEITIEFTWRRRFP